MKEYLFLLLAILPFAAAAQKKLDTIVLKNGKTIPGYIYKMEGGTISITNNGDSITYTAAEVQSIMFCHSVRSNGASSGSGYSNSESKSKTSMSSGGGASYGAKPCDDNNQEKGAIIFQCNMCGSKGAISIKGGMDNSKTTGTYSFELDNGERFTTYTQRLPPGTYTWTYKDNASNQTKGTFTIQKAEEKKIILFEKEN
jgi:hypothetical protein